MICFRESRRFHPSVASRLSPVSLPLFITGELFAVFLWEQDRHGSILHQGKFRINSNINDEHAYTTYIFYAVIMFAAVVHL